MVSVKRTGLYDRKVAMKARRRERLRPRILSADCFAICVSVGSSFGVEDCSSYVLSPLVCFTDTRGLYAKVSHRRK